MITCVRMSNNQTEFFNLATQRLLTLLDTMNLAKEQLKLATHYTLTFRNSFTDTNVKKQTFADEGIDLQYLTYASDVFCRASSKTFAKLMNLYSQRSDWQVMYIDNLWTYGSHHFIKHIPSKTNFDLTYDQYEFRNIAIPYYLGTPINMSQKDNMPQKFALANGIDLTNKIQEKSRF